MRLLIFLQAYKPIIALILVSLALRLWRLDELVTIGGDLGNDLAQIKSILDGNLTLLGPQISHFGDSVLFLGPLYYYIQAPFLALSNLDPIGLSIIIIIARLTTTVFIYLAAKEIFNHKVALIASILSILSPYFVNSLGLPSYPYLIPPLSAIIIYLVVKTQNAKSFPQISRLAVLVGFLSGLTTNFHYLGLSLFLAYLLLLFFSNIRKKTKTAVFLTSGFLISILPILIFELRNKFFLSTQIVSQISSGVVTAKTQSVVHKLTSTISFFWQDIIGVNLPFIFCAAFLVLSVVVTYTTVQKSKKTPILFLISLVIINTVAVILYSQPAQSHYLAAAYVPMFIFVAYLICYARRFNRVIPLILITVITIVLIGRNDLQRSSGYTMPEDLTLAQIEKISKIIADDASGQKFNITSTLDGDSRALPYRYLVDVYGKKPLDVETYDKGDSLYVITRDPSSSVRENLLFEIASFQPSNIVKTWNINGDIKLIKLSKIEAQEKKIEKFVTVVNPVRSRDLWQDRSIENLKKQIRAIDEKHLPSSWLLQYDTLKDPEITEVFKPENKNIEVGAFLEVSEDWATDARVSYIVGDGDYYRPDKVFLSGYDPEDRIKLLKTYIKKYQQIFGHNPQVAGAWYVDARSQEFLSEAGFRAVLVVADQYDTDAAASWGKYWSMPFYPSKYNSLQPAANQRFRIPIVNIQWAQRHPTLGYGKGIEDSRQSFQANDYINNGFDSEYFDELLDIYLFQQKTDFVQITLGLEIGQEAQTFSQEFDYQLDKIKSLQGRGELEAVTMGDFAEWYQSTYPGISPSHFFTYQDNFWYMSPKLRLAVFKENQGYILKDLLFYDQTPLKDYFYKDRSHFLDRKVIPTVSDVEKSEGVNLGQFQDFAAFENFDRLTIKSDNEVVRSIIAPQEIRFDDKKMKFRSIGYLNTSKTMVQPLLTPLKYSTIEGQTVFGIAIGETLVGFRGPRPGIHKFNFQTLSKFQTSANILEKYQPWLR